ncbi:hypothetical protein GE061_019962 [Apolygus lucorum]|uniref:Uncharacterized protein n=1 Tax=Apolygus lucorum TaxID=248454 RepID=A0A8S9XBY8_APOLU|nr:hypothetical protein GE061_019962 [Apolygus lucorum]
MNSNLLAACMVVVVIAACRNAKVVCSHISALASTAHTHVDHSRIPIPRVMKVKFVPRILLKTTQIPLVTLPTKVTPNASLMATTLIACKNLSLELPTDENANCSKPLPGALQALLSREPVDADQCVPSTNDSLKIGVITCPCCKRKIEINIQLNKVLSGKTCNSTKSRDTDNIDYHSNS